MSNPKITLADAIAPGTLVRTTRPLKAWCVAMPTTPTTIPAEVIGWVLLDTPHFMTVCFRVDGHHYEASQPHDAWELVSRDEVLL